MCGLHSLTDLILVRACYWLEVALACGLELLRDVEVICVDVIVMVDIDVICWGDSLFGRVYILSVVT